MRENKLLQAKNALIKYIVSFMIFTAFTHQELAAESTQFYMDLPLFSDYFSTCETAKISEVLKLKQMSVYVPHTIQGEIFFVGN